jgi:very-short-patch-repair endonuclease
LKEASKYVVDGCASPMEAKVVAIMTLPGRLGGFGLPLPESNVPIVLDAEKSKQFHRTEFYPDFIWRDKKLIVEYDSNEWHFENDASGSKAKRDRKRADALVSLGYIVRSLTAGTLFNYEELCTYMASLQIVLEGRKNRSGDVTASRRKRLSSDILFAQDPLSGIYDSRTYRDRHNGGFHAGAV